MSFPTFGLVPGLALFRLVLLRRSQNRIVPPQLPQGAEPLLIQKCIVSEIYNNRASAIANFDWVVFQVG